MRKQSPTVSGAGDSICRGESAVSADEAAKTEEK